MIVLSSRQLSQGFCGFDLYDIEESKKLIPSEQNAGGANDMNASQEQPCNEPKTDQTDSQEPVAGGEQMIETQVAEAKNTIKNEKESIVVGIMHKVVEEIIGPNANEPTPKEIDNISFDKLTKIVEETEDVNDNIVEVENSSNGLTKDIENKMADNENAKIPENAAEPLGNENPNNFANRITYCQSCCCSQAKPPLNL